MAKRSSALRKTYFQSEWLDTQKYPVYAMWLVPVEGDKSLAKCLICDKTFNLSNMGKQAVDSHNKASNNQFPKKFCGHRWLENMPVVERALELMPKIIKYMEEVKPKPAIPSFARVQAALKDKFLKSKLEFFKSIATELESFLTVFQSQKPLAPFLFDHLLSILEALFCRIAKASVLKNLKVSELLKILRKLDSSYNGLKPVKEIDIGIGIDNSPEVAKKRFEQAVDHLLDAKRITTTEADKAVKEYREFISSPETKSKLESFSKTDNRLDELYYSSMGDKPQMANLWKCFKTLLLVSHGNAMVEGGFSVNGDILVENLVERSVVAQRTIFDALCMAGGAFSINIDKEMLVKVRSSHSALKDHMEKMRKAEKEGLKGTEQRKRDLLLLKEKEAKKRKLQEEFEKASADVVALQKKVYSSFFTTFTTESESDKTKNKGNEREVVEVEESESERDIAEALETRVPATLVLFILLSYTGISAAIFTVWEGWAFINAFYFSFITMATVGFGDLVPSRESYLFFAILIIVLGLVLTTMCIDLVGTHYIRKIHFFGRKIKDARQALALLGDKAGTVGDWWKHVRVVQHQYGLSDDELRKMMMLRDGWQYAYIPSDAARMAYIDNVPSSDEIASLLSCFDL